MTMTNVNYDYDDDDEIVEYRKTVSRIHYAFEELMKLLRSQDLTETQYFISVAYKTFSDKVFNDIKNNKLI